MAQKTGQISSEITFSKKLALIFSVSTSPTQPKSMVFTGLLCAGIRLASAPEKPIESKPFFCEAATIFLLIKPA